MKAGKESMTAPAEASDTAHEDDFFGNQDEDSQFEKERQEREIAAVRRHHYTAGLREGASSARDAHLQRGFDDGFLAGSQAVSKPAFLLGASNVLEAFYSKNGYSRSSNARWYPLGDTEVLTEDVGRLGRVNTDLRAKLRNMPLDSNAGTAEALEACERVAVINLPPYMLGFP